MLEEDVLEQLQWQVMTLKETMQTLNQMVNETQPQLDTLEDVILASKQEVRTASAEIVIAQEYKSSWYYYTAGLIASVGTTVALLLLL
jgi:hypothetical protein